ncbi:MAG: hypothetical protein KF729_09360 [Sandaracinaceae bacterium]|nr:hypothetical protein [Sandaracinaceae bacterium]
MRWRAATIALVAGLLAGCLSRHDRDGALDADTGAQLDAGPRPDAGPWLDDAMAADGMSPPRDAGFEPEECLPPSDPPCFCYSESRRPSDNICITPRAVEVEVCDVGYGCPVPGWLCNYLPGESLGREPRRLHGFCTELAMCAWLREREWTPRCYYDDGTPHETGELMRTACQEQDIGRAIVCGPECGVCAGGRVCVGLSERSGIGLCVRGVPGDSPDRCGEGYPSCPGDWGCLGFVLPDGVSLASQASVWHSCVPRDACDDLAGRYPERFYCLR